MQPWNRALMDIYIYIRGTDQIAARTRSINTVRTHEEQQFKLWNIEGSLWVVNKQNTRQGQDSYRTRTTVTKPYALKRFKQALITSPEMWVKASLQLCSCRQIKSFQTHNMNIIFKEIRTRTDWAPDLRDAVKSF